MKKKQSSRTAEGMILFHVIEAPNLEVEQIYYDSISRIPHQAFSQDVEG